MSFFRIGGIAFDNVRQVRYGREHARLIEQTDLESLSGHLSARGGN
jgi:hypothetical protein